MHLTLDSHGLVRYFSHVLDANFPAEGTSIALRGVVAEALERTEACFTPITLPGYRRDGKPVFNHEHADQRAIFTYYASNSAFRMGDKGLATRLFLLNKMQNALVCMYDTQMPEIFLLIHTVGTVLGKASYSNYFVAYQNVTIGTEDGRACSFDEHVVVYGGSTVIGNSSLGRGSVVSAHSLLIDETIPANSLAIGRSPHLEVKPRKRDFAVQYWDVKP